MAGMSIKTIKTGVFKKKIKFEITYDGEMGMAITDYKYSIAGLVYWMMENDFSKDEVYKVLNLVEPKILK